MSSKSNVRLRIAERPAAGGTSCALPDKTLERRSNALLILVYRLLEKSGFIFNSSLRFEPPLRLAWATVALTVLALFASSPALAQPDIDGVIADYPDPMQVAFPTPYIEGSVQDGAALAATALDVLSRDLKLSRNLAKPNFEILPNRLRIDQLDGKDRERGGIHYSEWSTLHAMYVIKITLRATSPGKLQLDLLLHDIGGEKALLAKRSGAFPAAQLRKYVHNAADDIVERTTPGRGIASTQIAFVNYNRDEKEIFTVDYDGYKESVKQITDFGSTTLFPSWSSDGLSLTYTSYKSNWCDAYIHRLASPGSKSVVRVLSERPGNNLAPRWNPADSREMVISLSHKGNPEIYLINASGDILRRLTNDPGIDVTPCVTPNGQEIVWTSDRVGRRPQLFIMDKDGANSRRLTRVEGGLRCDTASFSPVKLDGGYRIAFYGSHGSSTGDIYTIRPDGTGVMRITDGRGNNENPTWSPDGMYIAYSSNRRGPSQVYVASWDGSAPVGEGGHMRLTYLNGNNLSPAWSPAR